MPLEEIRKDIESTARSEAERVKKEAEAEVRRIVKDAEEKAKTTEQDAGSWTSSETQRLRKEHDASLEIETHNMMLEAMNEVVMHHLKAVKKQVAKRIEEEHMRDILKAALAKFAESVPLHDAILTTGKANAKLIESLKPKCEVKYGNVEGVQLRSKDGRISLEVNSDMIADANEDEIKGIMASTLFPQKEMKRPEPRAAKPKAKAKAAKRQAKGKRR